MEPGSTSLCAAKIPDRKCRYGPKTAVPVAGGHGISRRRFLTAPAYIWQPHPIAAFKHSHKAAGPGESPSAQSSTTQSTARASEAVSSEPQKEKQALYRPRRPSPKGRARELDDNPEIVAALGYARSELGLASLHDRGWSPVAELHPWQDQWNYR